jgi:hypothetical protein
LVLVPFWSFGLSVVGVPFLQSFVSVPFGLVSGSLWLFVGRQQEASK